MSHERKQLELRRLARSRVVRIHGSYPCATPENNDARQHFSMVGTIIVAKPEYCYVVVQRALIRDGGSYEIHLPDGSIMQISDSEFSVPNGPGHLAGFYIHHSRTQYDITRLAEADFGDDVVLLQDVYLCDFHNEYQNLNITGGRVLDAEDAYFTHDCGPSGSTANGSPVFYENGKLVGFCTLNMQGPSNAITISAIKRHLNRIYGTQTLEEFRSQVQLCFSLRFVAGSRVGGQDGGAEM